MMNFPVDLDIYGPNSLVKDMNCWTTYTSNLEESPVAY